MWDIRLKTTMYSIRSNGPYLTLIGTVLTAFPGKGCYLKAQFLHDTLNFLLVHANPLILQLTGHTPISIIFMLAADFLYFVLYFLVRIHAVKPFLPVHIGRFGHLSIGEKVFQFE